MKPWVAYTLLRVGLFAGVFAVLMLLGIEWWLSAVLAAVIGLCVAYIFFGRLRSAVAKDLAERRMSRRIDEEAAVEDD